MIKQEVKRYFKVDTLKQEVKRAKEELLKSTFKLVYAELSRPAERGGRRGHCPSVRGHMGARGSELSGLECKIDQFKLRPANAMMFFFYFGPKFEHLQTLYDLILLIARC